MKQTATYRVTFEIGDPNSGTAYGRIYKNGVAFGTERLTSLTSPVSYSEDLAFTAGDLLQLYVRNDSAQTNYSGFKVEAALVPANWKMTVNL